MLERKHIITISGKPGSGKSSTADRVAELLGYSRYSSGDLVRKHTKRRGITLMEFNRQAANDHEIDNQIDEELRKLRNDNDLVIDSRLGFYWIPESFKVYLDLDIDVATARIFKDAVNNGGRSSEIEAIRSLGDVQKQVQARLNAEARRFRSLYGINPYDTSHFDLIVNTSRHSPETVALAIFDSYKKWLKTEEWHQEHSSVPIGYSFEDTQQNTNE